jgi:catechol 2,3-dioxygenase-like lactoylglutathione lyase family enzyme
MSSSDSTVPAAIHAAALDHVALWVSDRQSLSAFLCTHLGMHEISKTDSFTLVGADARRGKLTLFDAEGPREPGALDRVVLRVHDLDAAIMALPTGLNVTLDAFGVATFTAADQLELGLRGVPDADLDFDLDEVRLTVAEPDIAADELAGLGFDRDGRELRVAEKRVRLTAGSVTPTERPLLNHLALLVDSAQEVDDRARARGLEIAERKDADNVRAVFIWGPEQIKIEYVEHKPEFALV